MRVRMYLRKYVRVRVCVRACSRVCVSALTQARAYACMKVDAKIAFPKLKSHWTCPNKHLEAWSLQQEFKLEMLNVADWPPQVLH